MELENVEYELKLSIFKKDKEEELKLLILSKLKENKALYEKENISLVEKNNKLKETVVDSEEVRSKVVQSLKMQLEPSKIQNNKEIKENKVLSKKLLKELKAKQTNIKRQIQSIKDSQISLEPSVQALKEQQIALQDTLQRRNSTLRRRKSIIENNSHSQTISILIQKEIVETSIAELKISLEKTNGCILNTKNKFSEILEKIKSVEIENVEIFSKKSELMNNFDVLFKKKQKFKENFDFNKEIQDIKQKLAYNKLEYERLEDEVTKKLLFLKFSDKMVASMNAVINSRKLQEDMFISSDPSERKSYEFLFNKLDQLEDSLYKEYFYYIDLINEAENEHSIQ